MSIQRAAMRRALRHSDRNCGPLLLAENLEARRLMSAGFLDPSFNAIGYVTAHYRSNNDGVASAVQADGKIIVVGDTQATGGTKDAFITRYNPDGTVDTSYGSNGITTLNLGADEIATGVGIDTTSGNAVVCGVTGSGLSGQIFVARYNTSGQLDTSFNSTGTRTISLFGDSSAASDIWVKPNGQIVVVGTVQFALGADMAIAILNQDGSNFDIFGGAGGQYAGEGAITVQTGHVAVATSIAKSQLTAHYIASGFDVDLSTGKMTFVVGAFNVDGSGAIHFGSIGNGEAPANFGKNIEPALGVAVDPSTQKIYAVGATSNGAVQLVPGLPTQGDSGHATSAQFAVARFNSDGSLDTGFNGTGMATAAFSSSGKAEIAGASDVVLQSDGKIVVAGGAEDAGGGSNFVTARFTAAGTLDPSFATAGESQIDFGASDGAFGLAIQSDDQVIEVGHTKASTSNSSVVVLRLTNDGSPVTSNPAGTSGGGGSSGTPSFTTALAATLPPAVVGGTKATGFKGSLKIDDSGTAAATGAGSVSVYLSTDQSLDTSADTLLSVTPIKFNLKPKASQSVSLKFKNVPSLNGTYYLLTQVSGGGTSSPAVAVSKSTVHIAPPFVELASTGLSVKPASVKRGGKATLTVNVLNSGNVPTAKTLPADVAVSLSADGSDPIDLGAAAPGSLSLAAGKKKAVKFVFTVPQSLAPGVYHVVLTIDPANTFGESSLADNTTISTGTLTVS